jgi:hypothetical protein
MRIVVVVLVCALAAPAAARSGGGGDGASASAVAAFDRRVFLGVSGGIEGAFLLTRAGELAFGRDANRSLAGLQIAMAAPCFIYGSNLVRAGGWDDPLVVGSTVVAGALIGHSIYVLARPREEPPRLSIGPGSIAYAVEF